MGARGEAAVGGVGEGGHCDQVDMIGHEAVAPDFLLGLKRRFAQNIKVQRIVSIVDPENRTIV